MKNVTKVFSQLKCGDIKMKPCVVMENGEMIFPEYKSSLNEKAGTLSLVAQYKEEFRDSLYFNCSGDEITCRRSFDNISGKTLAVKELCVVFSGIDFGENREDDYYYHNENSRVYMQMTFRIDHYPNSSDAKSSDFDVMAGNRWHDEGVIHPRAGCSPNQPFPAILFSNYNTKKGLVHGSLSQNVFYHNYSFCHTDEGVEVQAYSSFKTISHMDIKPGKVLIDEWYIGLTPDADNLEKIFERYIKVLRRKLPVNYGRTDINRDNMVWGSWNDGIRRTVTEEMVLRETQYLKENFPTVKWIQLDDGYAKEAVRLNIAHGIGMVYEGEDGLDKEKFPNGLRSYTDKIREIGLRPAIWIGGFCPKDTKIYKEHPEWFFDYDYRVTNTAPLDVSIKEVREYMQEAINVLCRQYGFDAVKHDFWSYAFEDTLPLLRNKDRSGYEYRDWWLKTIRNAIPADGYLQTGCDIVMGNPFLGKYFTNYRYGIDIGGGNWENVVTNFLWGTACFALHIGDLFVPNSDSIGMLPGLEDDEAYFCINYCLVTHSMVEIAGLLSKAEHNERYRMLKKAACNPNNGQDIYFIGYNYRDKNCYTPEIIYFNTPHFSRVEESSVMPVKTVGLFNLSEESKELSFSPEDMGLSNGEYILTNVWTGEQHEFNGKVSFNVRKHASMLLAVSKNDEMQLYDANIRINKATIENNSMIFETDYAVKAVEMFFSQKANKISLNGKNVEFTLEGNTVFFDADEAGTLRVEF